MSGKKIRIEVVSSSNHTHFTSLVNVYLSRIEDKGFDYDIEYGRDNWAIDGESGSNHFAYIKYWKN